MKAGGIIFLRDIISDMPKIAVSLSKGSFFLSLLVLGGLVFLFVGNLLGCPGGIEEGCRAGTSIIAGSLATIGTLFSFLDFLLLPLIYIFGILGVFLGVWLLIKKETAVGIQAVAYSLTPLWIFLLSRLLLLGFGQVLGDASAQYIFEGGNMFLFPLFII